MSLKFVAKQADVETNRKSYLSSAIPLRMLGRVALEALVHFYPEFVESSPIVHETTEKLQISFHSF